MQTVEMEQSGETIKLNRELIPSPVIDSLEPNDYVFDAVTDAVRLRLQEVKIDGGMNEQGPFDLGVIYGTYALRDNVELPERLRLPLILGD